MFKIFLVMALVLTACSGDSNSIPRAFRYDPSFYFGDSGVASLEVYFEEGAEPFVGDFSGSNPTLQKVWDLTFLNLEDIFSFKTGSTQINVPRELNEMQPLGSLEDESWTVDDILDLADSQDIQSINGSEAIFNIFFVNGFFESNGVTVNNVVGVNISGTSIVVIFKDVINNMMPLSFRAFYEQATVVHEIGHALGLVNNGVPVVADHFDGENGAHSNDDTCIMFYLNEGAADLIQFIIDFNNSGDTTLWGPGVLEDVEAFSR
jgi:hypothetical protein